MKPTKFLSSALFVAGISALVIYGCKNQDLKPTVTSDAKSGSQSSNVYGTPGLSSPGSTEQSIDITFTAGTYGAPSGFSIQWMPAAQFIAGGSVWPDTNATCKASFSGNAYMSRYSLANAGDQVTVTIGDLLMDNGASSNCNGDLQCGTDYVFRTFSHGDSKRNRSAFSATFTASTLPCATGNCIVGGLGYWKNLDISNWPGYTPTATLTLGTNTYTYAQCMQILQASNNKDGLLNVAHQLIPAMLNQLEGATGYDFTDAQKYIGSQIIEPVTGYVVTDPKTAATLVSTINGGDHTCH